MPRKITEIIKLILPPFLLSFLKWGYRRIKYSFFIQKVNIQNLNVEKDNYLCILGNGPSLSKSIEKYKSFIEANDCLVCNFFANTNLFEELKPKFYLLADPSFFYEDVQLLSDQKQARDNLISNLITKTHWNISLLVPATAYNSVLTERLKSDYITFYFYNNVEYKTIYSKKTKFRYWDKGILPPPAQTVINTAVYFGIFLNYQTTYLFGIDTTYFNALEVDQKTNIVYSNLNHFYKSSRVPWYIDPKNKKGGKVHEIADTFVTMFRLYWELREYADYKGVEVFNASEFSMVDAFKRQKPDFE